MAERADRARGCSRRVRLEQITAAALAFLHIDMNCAYPERAALETLWPRLSPGAIVLFDDYAYLRCESEHAAITQAAAGLGVPILALPTAQGVILKPPTVPPQVPGDGLRSSAGSAI